MKEAFVDYFKMVGMGGPFLHRASQLCDECEILIEHSFEDSFASDIIADGRRLFSNLYFFTNKAVVKVENFAERPLISMQRLDRVSACTEFSSGPFKEVGDKSIMQATCTWEPIPFSLQLLATGQNCGHFLKIVQTYIIPWLAPSSPQAGT
jgi:hypothetical protein